VTLTTGLKLHGYQELARDFLRNRGRAGLFLDMGLGKTAISLSAIEERHLPVLVVAPKRVAEHTWPAERDLWRPDLSLALAAGTKQQREQALAAGADITVISRDNLADARPIYKTVVLDELSSFKNRSSMRWKAARRLTTKADYVWGLTGTPSPNGYLDLWAQVFLLDNGERLDTASGRYQQRYFQSFGQLPSGVQIDWRPRPGAEETIRDLLSDLCLYMSSDDELDMPPVTYNSVVVDMPGAARSMYDQLREDMCLVVDEDTYSASSAAVLSNRLSQLSAGFLYSDEQDGTYTPVHKAKLEALAEIMEGTGDNVLVFYNFLAERDMIKAAFKQARLIDEPGVLAGWNKGEVPMMLAHPASAGHGLNLQHGGHTMVWTSLTWDLELYQQACKRLDRQGQQHPVVIHDIQCRRTVDQVIAARLDTKADGQYTLLDHLRSPM
jgi:SNF2 family DNA or RNA helicase